jgi:hypothetical protein
MAKVDGCWAKCLDDCWGLLTGEHNVSVGVFSSSGPKDNRSARVRRKVTIEGGPRELRYQQSVDNLKERILCEGHNSGTSDLDTAAKELARAIEEYDRTRRARIPYPGLNWSRKVIPVNGPLVQRWLLKTLINNAHHHAQPMGGPHGLPGKPTPEMVEMVFGRRQFSPMRRMFALINDDTADSLDERFGFIYTGPNADTPYLAIGVMNFRGIALGCQFTDDQLPEVFRCPDPRFDKSKLLIPLLTVEDDTRVVLRFVW